MATQTSVKERTGIKLKEPKQYCVVMYNDDFTTMDFVVEILVDIFHKDSVTAEALMSTIHRQGKVIVGKYPYDIAASKVSEALNRAKEQGFPFRVSVEEA